MKLSVVIISWQSLSMLKKCLASLDGVYQNPRMEIIWVDNGSSDGSAAFVKDNYPHIKQILLNRNYGVAYARNRGIEKARGQYILLLDDDTEASDSAIASMTEFLDSHPDAGICGVALCDSDGNLQQSFKPYPGIGQKIKNLIVSKPATVQLPPEIIYPAYIIGACQMFRRELTDKIGLLDEAIFYGPEDADFCMRIAAAGFKVAYLPHARIMHHWRRITNRNLFSKISLLHMRGLLHLYVKHRRLF